MVSSQDFSWLRLLCIVLFSLINYKSGPWSGYQLTENVSAREYELNLRLAWYKTSSLPRKTVSFLISGKAIYCRNPRFILELLYVVGTHWHVKGNY